jgi:hypothetical protein
VVADLGARRRRPRRRARLAGLCRRFGGGHAHPDVSRRARARRSRAQRLDRIDVERQRFVLDPDPLDRFRCGQLVDRRHGEDRFAAVERLIGQRPLVERARLDRGTVIGHAACRPWQIVSGQDRLDAGQRQRFARIEADARMWHLAEQELGEQHSLGSIVFGVLRLAGDLGDDVGRRVVVPDVLVVRHDAPHAKLVS